MKIFRRNETERASRAGYAAEYIADIALTNPIDSAGFILVTVPKGSSTTPHAHAELEEVFVALNRVRIGVDDSIIGLELGDIVLVEPKEKHWIQSFDEDARMLAIKLPNLKEDKIVTN